MSEVVFIGTSDAFGACGRRQSAILLRAPNGSVLLDCGTTTVTGLCDLDIARDEIDAILISHFHGDHFAGIPALLLGALYEDGRTRPLHIAGPIGIEQYVRKLAAAMCYALEDRDWSFPIAFIEFSRTCRASSTCVEPYAGWSVPLGSALQVIDQEVTRYPRRRVEVLTVVGREV